MNTFRKVLRGPVTEQWLKSAFSRSSLYPKIVPPEYLYKHGTWRDFEEGGVHYRLDISKVVDHYVYFGMEDYAFKKELNVIQNAKVILDIGANIGISFSWFVRHNPNVRIIAFEPHPETAKRALEQIERNNFKNVELIQVALGSEEAELSIYEVEDHNPGMNRVSYEKLERPSRKVPVKRLDDVLASLQATNPDFIKMDVEGFEYFVLLGATKTLRSCPVLFIEVNDQYLTANGFSASQMIRFLEEKGYNSIRRSDTDESLRSDSQLKNCHFDIIAKKI
ncbi:MAG: FkbM family methyltransferase [Bacteroidia bacterium]